MTHRAIFTVVSPVAKTVSIHYAELPEDREIEADAARLGVVSSIEVIVPTDCEVISQRTVGS